MFTGLVEDVGRFVSLSRRGRAASLTIEAEKLPVSEVKIGDSVAVNGACLTLESAQGNQMQFHCLAETLSRTNLGGLRSGAPVNLERALACGQRMGGHIVTGHIDFTAELLPCGADPVTGDLVLKVQLLAEQAPFFVEKGSVALNGTSLTIASLDETSFSVCLIPHTAAMTNLGQMRAGELLNVESDLLGKYVVRALSCQNRENRDASLLKKLQENGFF